MFSVVDNFKNLPGGAQLKYNSSLEPSSKKNWVLPEQLLSYIIFEQLYCYEVTLVKKYNKPVLQKSETKISTKKRFIKILLKVNEKKNSGVKSDNV